MSLEQHKNGSGYIPEVTATEGLKTKVDTSGTPNHNQELPKKLWGCGAAALLLVPLAVIEAAKVARESMRYRASTKQKI